MPFATTAKLTAKTAGVSRHRYRLHYRPKVIDPNGDVYSLEEVCQTGTNRVLPTTSGDGVQRVSKNKQPFKHSTDYVGAASKFSSPF